MPDFKQLPDNLLVPGMYQEIDNSLAGTREETKRILLIGSFSSTGNAKDGKIERITSSIKAAALFGYGSNLSIMAENFLAINNQDELYALPVAESGTAFSEKYKIEIAEGSSGNISVKINEREANISVLKGDSAETVAGKITASINTIFNLPISAEAEENTITFASISKGNQGIILNIESDNSKISLTSIEKTDAADSPISDWKKYFEAMGETRYNYIINSFNDSNTLKSFASELEDRYSALRQIGARMFVCLSSNIGDESEANSIIGKTKKINSPHIAVVPIVKGEIVKGEQESLNTSYLPSVFLTRIAATAIDSLIKDPSSNTLGLEVAGISADKPLSFEERQSLLLGGVSTYTLDTAGNISIERLVVSYTTNSEGERDTSYLDIQTVETIDAIRNYINTEAKRRFKGWKLSSDSSETFGAGAKVMTVEVWKSFLCEIYKQVFVEEKQWAQDFNSYKDSLTAQIKTGSKTRLEYSHKPNLIGQFYIGAGLNQFK